MKPDLRNNKDFLAGLVFVIIGVLAVVLARAYPMGVAARMGPGYFPTVLGGLLTLVGLYVLIRGLASGAKVAGEWGWKPLAWVVLAILLFGFMLERFGMVPALVATFFAATLAGPEYRFKEVVLLTAVMSALAVALFFYGLKLPFRLFGGY